MRRPVSDVVTESDQGKRDGGAVCVTVALTTSPMIGLFRPDN